MYQGQKELNLNTTNKGDTVPVLQQILLTATPPSRGTWQANVRAAELRSKTPPSLL